MGRVMHVLAPSPVGGLERVVQSLAVAQAADPRLGDVQVVTLSQAPIRKLEEFLAPLQAGGVRVETIVTPARAYARQREELRALIERVRPEVVHTHGAHADVLGWGLAERVDASSVSTLHGFVGGGPRNRFYEWLQRRSCRSRDAVVAVSRPLARALANSGFAPERTHVIRNTWGPGTTAHSRSASRAALGLPSQGFIVGWVGRISREKGLDVLIDALRRFPTLDVRLAVVGDGDDRRALEQRAATLALAPLQRLHWLGMRPDAARTLAAFDVLVLSSRTEGTPMLLFEAMAAGVPIVASAVGGIPDAVSASEALLVPSEDPRALYDAIDLVQRDATGARGRVEAATRRLRLEHDVAHWAECYASVYDAARATAALRRAPTAHRSPITARRAAPASRALSAP